MFEKFVIYSTEYGGYLRRLGKYEHYKGNIDDFTTDEFNVRFYTLKGHATSSCKTFPLKYRKHLEVRKIRLRVVSEEIA